MLDRVQYFPAVRGSSVMITERATVTVLLRWLNAHLFYFLTRLLLLWWPSISNANHDIRKGERQREWETRETCGNLHALSLSHSVWNPALINTVISSELRALSLRSHLTLSEKHLVGKHLYWLMQQGAQVGITTVNGVIIVAVWSISLA